VEGTVPLHRPRTPSSLMMCLTTAVEVLWGLSLDCSRVLRRSMGLEAQAARAPLRDPAATFLTIELFSLVAPNRFFAGP
jgi:hypothetical protein